LESFKNFDTQRLTLGEFFDFAQT